MAKAKTTTKTKAKQQPIITFDARLDAAKKENRLQPLVEFLADASRWAGPEELLEVTHAINQFILYDAKEDAYQDGYDDHEYENSDD